MAGIVKVVEIASAIIKKENRVFATQRGYREFKGMWEFSGGKVEPGETPEEAVVREVWEELETEVLAEQCFAETDYDYPDFHLHMKCYLCTIKSGNLKLLEHSEAKWLTRETLDSVEWLPADVTIIEMLKNII
ncbi:MAG: (deoxy)nucleoside triphosphate pyrophosphohydrolase [Lachnospiraceae bacterium]|nr:(deoxy)nucleoside triphosphate pyrophosphohydrolase [Lachnospiraceae bacterium]